ncbi:MAG TPA: MFS transporter, partial [Spirochaetota bacterium]|nr:MFS transporter [Spirochaetota bacterium]
IIFVNRQNKLSEPLINLKPLSVKPFTAGIVINMISLVIIFAMNIVLPIYLQNANGESSFATSLALFPAIILSCVTAPVAGRLYDRHGVKFLLPSGFILICAFTSALAFIPHGAPLIAFAALYIPVICGSALIIGPMQSFALSRLKPELNPHGITVLSTGFQIAGCIGSSVFTGLYFAIMSSGISAGSTPRDASGAAFTSTALLAAVFAAAGLALAAWIVKLSRAAVNVRAETRLRAIMKTDVYTVSGSATIRDALELIIAKKVSGVPVLGEDGNLSGFISDGDILRHLANSHPLFVNAYSLSAVGGGDREFDLRLRELMNMKVSDIAHTHVITVNEDDDLGEVCRVLSERKLKKAPVMKNGKMTGIINTSNITKHAVKRFLSGE